MGITIFKRNVNNETIFLLLKNTKKEKPIIMSVNLNLKFEIHNIESLQLKENEEKRNDIYAVVLDFLEGEEIWDETMKLEFIGQKGYLSAYTLEPMIISGAYDWIPRITKAWEELVFTHLGSTAQPIVIANEVDEE
jgi:hypothetical protein